MERPYRIIINGWYGQHNAGDDAILDMFLQHAGERGCTTTVLSEFPQHLATPPGVDAAPHPVIFGRGAFSALLDGSVWRHIRRVADCDVFVLGGGGLLRDNTNWRNLLRLLDEIWLAKLCGRKTMLYAIGVGPFRTRIGKRLIGATVRMCDLITVRSERCAALLRGLGVDPVKIHVVADPAFLLPSQAPASTPQGLDPILFSGGRRLIGFYPTIVQAQRKDDELHLRQVAAALDQIVEEQGADIVAVPMSVLDNGRDDVLAARAVRARMRQPERFHVCTQRLSAQELKWVTGQMTLNVTVRLHAMIFSLGAGVPVVALNYEPKVAHVFSAYGMPECLVQMDADLPQALPAAVARCAADLPGYAARIRAQSVRTAADAVRTFQLFGALVQPPAAARAPAERRLAGD